MREGFWTLLPSPKHGEWLCWVSKRNPQTRRWDVSSMYWTNSSWWAIYSFTASSRCKNHSCNPCMDDLTHPMGTNPITRVCPLVPSQHIRQKKGLWNSAMFVSWVLSNNSCDLMDFIGDILSHGINSGIKHGLAGKCLNSPWRCLFISLGNWTKWGQPLLN